MKLKIKVTQEHIDKALAKRSQCESSLCPVALAIREVCNVGVGVGLIDYSIYSIPTQVGFLPEIARKFIVKFDGERPVDPIEFEIEPKSYGKYGIEQLEVEK